MDEPLFDTSLSTRVVLGVLSSLLMVVVLVVNLVVWMVMRLTPARNTTLKHCHITIILVNLVTAVFTLPAQILHISLGHWPLGMPVCIFTITVNSVAFVEVMWFIMVLVMDRVVKSNFHHVYLSLKKHSRVFHLLMWLILLVLTLLFFVAEFVKQSHKLGNIGSRFHCHVPFDATITFFLIVFGYAGPITIAGMMVTFLWFRIIKEKLIRRKKVTAANGSKYAANCDSRAMTPWGSNWLNGIETRVKMGPNNALPALRRHSIGKCEPEANTDLSLCTGNERRNSLPEEIGELFAASRERSYTDGQYYSSIDNSWSRMGLEVTSGKPPLEITCGKPPHCGSHTERSNSITGYGSSDKSKAKIVYNIKTSEKSSRNRVSYNLGSSNHPSTNQVWKTAGSNLSTNQNKDDSNSRQSRTPDSNFTVNQIKDNLSLPGSVQITESEQEAEVKLSDKSSETIAETAQTGKKDQDTLGKNFEITSPTQMVEADQQVAGIESAGNSEIMASPLQSGKLVKQTTGSRSGKTSNPQTAGTKSDISTSSVARHHTQCPSGNRESLSENQNKHNQWVRGSRVEDGSEFGCDDSYDDDCDDGEGDLRECKVLTIMVLLNIVLWLPMMWIYGRRALCDTCQVSLAVWTVVKIVGQVSLVTNPVCLLLTHRQWRPLLKYVLSGFGSFSFPCLQKW